MINFFRNYVKLPVCIVTIYLCSVFIVQSDAFARVKIPFETSKPIKLNVMLKDKNGNPVKTRVTFWEYKPPFKVDQTFGLKWEDLDFKTIEQVYLGFALFSTKEQYLSLHHGEKRKFVEEVCNKSNFEEEISQRDSTPLIERFNVYYSKLLIEKSGAKYAIIKSRFKGISGVGLGTYYFANGVIKDSDQVFTDLSIHDFLVAYQDKNTPEFIQWLKERQVKEGLKPAMIWFMIICSGIIFICILFYAVKRAKK